jgi:hypothetical protein
MPSEFHPDEEVPNLPNHQNGVSVRTSPNIPTTSRKLLDDVPATILPFNHRPYADVPPNACL